MHGQMHFNRQAHSLISLVPLMRAPVALTSWKMMCISYWHVQATETYDSSARVLWSLLLH
jgi:hypothetical protein